MDTNFSSNQQPGQQQYKNQNPQGQEIASLILGILSILVSFSIFGFRHMYMKGMTILACSIVGLILGIISNKKNKNGMATTGIILSGIALIILLLTMVACSACALIGCASLAMFF